MRRACSRLSVTRSLLARASLALCRTAALDPAAVLGILRADYKRQIFLLRRCRLCLLCRFSGSLFLFAGSLIFSF